MKQEIKQQIGQSVQDFRLPRYQEIPDVGLYLEQATKYICRYLSPILETPLTASMISNYVKRGLLSSPVKKQYSRDQVAYLFFIAVAKNVLSLDALAYQAAAALARREVFLLESEHIAAKPIPVEVHVRAIHQRIRTAKHLRFSQLVGPGTPKDVAVVTFLAILELYKRVMVRLEQDELFGDIAIDYIENSGDLRLEGDDALTSVGEE